MNPQKRLELGQLTLDLDPEPAQHWRDPVDADLPAIIVAPAELRNAEIVDAGAELVEIGTPIEGKPATEHAETTTSARAGAAWRGFAPVDERGEPVTDDAIRTAFDAIYHAKPAQIVRYACIVMAGPVTP